MTAGVSFRVSLDLVNAGWEEWRSDSENPVHLSYHWLERDGGMREFDGLRTDLPRPIAAGETCRVAINVKAPATPGDYRLAVDLVKEGVSWFSEVGMPWHLARVTVIDRHD